MVPLELPPWFEASGGTFVKNAPQNDFSRRCLKSLLLAKFVLESFETAPANSPDRTPAAGGLWREKVAAETAMLLLFARPLCDSAEVAAVFAEILHLLTPLARSPSVLATVCINPGIARDVSVGHAALSHLGFPDPAFDTLLTEALSGPDTGPEMLPHRKLEQWWLSRLWTPILPPTGTETFWLSETAIGRPLETLCGSRLDYYGFTHSAMYATDLGSRRLPGGRPPEELTQDAEAALAYSLETDDFDLTAEILLIWPLLGLPLPAAAHFALRVLQRREDELGFLPSRSFDEHHFKNLPPSARPAYAAASSYHTGYVMGFLCAKLSTVDLLARICCTSVPTLPLLRHSNSHTPQGYWLKSFIDLPQSNQASLGPLLLTVLLQKAAVAGDMVAITSLLEIARDFQLLRGPAVRQAAALLMRCRHINLVG